MKNKLSVWTWPCRPRYYILRPWKWVKELWINITNFIHRGRYGFACMDVWEWATWWPTVGAEALRYMAKYGHGYPGIEPWETPEKWKEHLLETAKKLDWCAESQDILFNDDNNEYSSKMDEITEKNRKCEKGEDGLWHTWLELNDEEKELRDKYFKREKELYEGYDKKRAGILSEIGRILPRYWD